jgi:hypothetical protein
VSPSGVLKVELVDSDGALVSSQYYRLKDGMAHGAVRIPEELESDTYTLRAYTRWMQNYGKQQFFTRQIRVAEDPRELEPSSGPELITSVAFHPEGGTLLAGVPNKLAITAMDALGCPIAFRGVLLDETEDHRYPVQSYGEGLGMTLFEPQAGKTYVLQLDNGARFTLPEVSEKGVALRINNLKQDVLRVAIEQAGGADSGTLLLSGTMDGATFFQQELKPAGTENRIVDIPKKGIPSGYLKIALSDMRGEVLTSRPVFIEGTDALRLDMEPLAEDFSDGGETAYRIRVTDAEGKPVSTELSFVARSGEANRYPGMLDYLKPGLEGEDVRTQRKNLFLEDLKTLSMNRADRSKTYPMQIKYPIQRGLELHAKVTNLHDDPLPNTAIQVVAASDENLVIQEARTDASGVLHLTDLDVVGETHLVFRTKGKDMQTRLVKAIPIGHGPKAQTSQEEPELTKEIKRMNRKKSLVESTPYVPFDAAGIDDQRGRPDLRTSDPEYKSKRLIQLRQATVEARERQRQLNPSTYGVQPLESNIVYQDPENPKPMMSLLRRIPGMIVQGEGTPNPQISNMRRGGKRPIWVLDGQVMGRSPSQFAGFKQEYDPQFSTPLFLVPARDIERIEYIFDATQTGAFGTQGGNGVILVYTRSGAQRSFKRKDAGLDFKGFEPGLDFGTYLEQREGDRKLRKQAPTTLYWNPAVQTDENGEAIVRFKSPSDYERVHIEVETLTADGRPGAVHRVSGNGKTLQGGK